MLASTSASPTSVPLLLIIGLVTFKFSARLFPSHPRFSCWRWVDWCCGSADETSLRTSHHARAKAHWHLAYRVGHPRLADVWPNPSRHVDEYVCAPGKRQRHEFRGSDADRIAAINLSRN